MQGLKLKIKNECYNKKSPTNIQSQILKWNTNSIKLKLIGYEKELVINSSKIHQ